MVTGLAVLALAMTALGISDSNLLPFSSLLVPLFLGSLVLGPRTLPWFVVGSLLCATLVLSTETDVGTRTIVRAVTVFAIGLLVLVTSFRRSRLGVSGPQTESMFIDLRDRIQKQARIPSLPRGWYVDGVLRSAGGTSFSGDFIVAAKSPDGTSLQVVVVDVSGKGVDAGTRSLLLSGAFGGLLSALEPEAFLPAANEFLLRQEWGEGFATAVHLHVDLVTGWFEVRKAGHPPAVWLHAGSGRWSVLDSEGPILGLLADAQFDARSGVIERGDAIMLYTDGVVETRRRDIGSGIDKLLGRAERLQQDGFERGASRMVDQLESTDDDRALLLIHRR